jgi:hypothetical protein
MVNSQAATSRRDQSDWQAVWQVCDTLEARMLLLLLLLLLLRHGNVSGWRVCSCSQDLAATAALTHTVQS